MDPNTLLYYWAGPQTDLQIGQLFLFLAYLNSMIVSRRKCQLINQLTQQCKIRISFIKPHKHQKLIIGYGLKGIITVPHDMLILGTLNTGIPQTSEALCYEQQAGIQICQSTGVLTGLLNGTWGVCQDFQDIPKCTFFCCFSETHICDEKKKNINALLPKSLWHWHLL